MGFHADIPHFYCKMRAEYRKNHTDTMAIAQDQNGKQDIGPLLKNYNMKQKIKLDTERMNGLGTHPFNLLYGLNDLCEKYIKEHHVILELGSNDGVSTELFSFFCHKIVSVDAVQTPNMKKLIMNLDNIDFYNMTFDEFYMHDKNNIYDLIYIDGFHDYNSVYNDIQKFKNKVKPQGILCGHDYNPYFPGVELAIKAHFPNSTIEFFSDSSWLINL